MNDDVLLFFFFRIDDDIELFFDKRTRLITRKVIRINDDRVNDIAKHEKR